MKDLLLHPSTRYYLAHPLEFLTFRLTILWLFAKMLFHNDVNLGTVTPSSVSIDVVMPTLEKDADVVAKVIQSIRANIQHPLGQIIIISPKSKTIQAMCKKLRCRWIDENTVLPITKKDIHFSPRGVDRSGWVFQQLLKWEAAKYVKSKYFLVSESDTIYIRKHVFLQDKKAIFACSSSLPHAPYFQTARSLYGIDVPMTHNFTSHHLLFEKSLLQEAKKAIEMRWKKKWYLAIIDHLTENELSPISDYDSYGQYVKARYPERIVYEHWANRNFPRNMLKVLPKLIRTYSVNTKTLSFHSYE